MFGAVIGDIVGSAHAASKTKSKEFPLLKEDCRFTDESVCTLALADALLHSLCPVKNLRQWCREYDVPYKDHFARWVADDQAGPYEGFCNGAAVRVSPAAFFARSHTDAQENAKRITEITHNHTRGQLGASAMTMAIWVARMSSSPRLVRDMITSEFRYDLRRTVTQVRTNYAPSVECERTIPEAILCATEATDFEDAIRNAISLGGEHETLAALTGAIAEALFGIPPAIKDRCRKYLEPRMLRTLDLAYKKVQLLG